MPVTRLFIEGKLESEVLLQILQGAPVLQVGGSKNSLKPRTRAERRENRIAAGYLRDRDFDFDPPRDLSKPTVDCEDDGIPIGWRWCRHEIENYLIEPAIVGEAKGWPISEVEEAISHAARKIRSYEAARWTIGIVRRELPPSYELQTRPDDLNEIDLPRYLDSMAVGEWASNSIEIHRNRIAAIADPKVVQESFDTYVDRFNDSFMTDTANILLWFSGKDILAGMADWLSAKAVENSGAFRASLRDWIIANPLRALELLPEWRNLAVVLRK